MDPMRALVEAARPEPVRRPVYAPDSWYARVGKPVFDRLVAAVLLVLSAPLTLMVVLAVAATVGRPLLFRQARVGLGGEPFTVLKFRTMASDRREAHRVVTEDRRVTHKSDRDPRHTGVGRLLRRYSLDELPQLWNVVRGDMSLVGPRPELVAVADRYEPWQRQREVVKPGITGLWQVTHRSDGELMSVHTDVDLAYIETMSFRRDLGILLRTLPAALSRTGR